MIQNTHKKVSNGWLEISGSYKNYHLLKYSISQFYNDFFLDLLVGWNASKWRYVYFKSFLSNFFFFLINLQKFESSNCVYFVLNYLRQFVQKSTLKFDLYYYYYMSKQFLLSWRLVCIVTSYDLNEYVICVNMKQFLLLMTCVPLDIVCLLRRAC